MTPQQLADLHKAAFQTERPWSADEFIALLASPAVSLIPHPKGFALTRTVADEIELLTLAVHPAHHLQGIADMLMTNWMGTSTATIAFLEVAADNRAAQQLYRKHGFAETGRRPDYYKRASAPSVDAVLMTAALPQGQKAESPATPLKIG